MREIKFRAMIPVNSDGPKTMSYYDLSRIDDLSRMAYEDFDASKLMQFTGLKDKNGKEIYEGDIVSVKGHWDYGDKNLKVEFQEGIFYPFTDSDWSLEMDRHQVEVIGNIYENPNLLTP